MPTKQRIFAIDGLRGFALLGILLMNIQSFSMPSDAYFNPTAYGNLTGVDLAVWAFSFIFADQKFMTIFSILFGVGVLLMQKSLQKQTLPTFLIFYRRYFILLLFGVAHAYLIWWGDILTLYALCGLGIYWVRNWSPKWQATLGILALSIGLSLNLLTHFSIPYMEAEQREELAYDWLMSNEGRAEEMALFQGSWAGQIQYRIDYFFPEQVQIILFWGMWRAGGLMLLGMALYQWGVFNPTEKPASFYWRLMALAGIGFPLVLLGLWQSFAHEWAFETSRFGDQSWNYVGSIFVSLSYIGGVMRLYQTDLLSGLKSRLEAVGQMALTNYLLHSFIATVIFYGFGLGWFGQVERLGQLIIVLAIWAVQLILSPIWLRYFYQGPFEWVWRLATYWHYRPIWREQPR